MKSLERHEGWVCLIFQFDCIWLTIYFSLQLGGTIGDIEGMPFVEAFRQFQFKAKRENFCNIHVSLVPQVSLYTVCCIDIIIINNIQILNYKNLFKVCSKEGEQVMLVQLWMFIFSH